MESEHISKSKLHAVVAGQATFNQAEIEHLRACEECLEAIRTLVRQGLSKGANG